MKVIYTKGHINSIQPYYVMLNGQRYNAAHFNGRIVFGKFDEVEPTVPPTEPPTEPPTIPPTPTPEPPTTTPFFVENITNSTETLTISRRNSDYEGTSATSLTIECSSNANNWTTLGTTSDTAITRTLAPGERLYLRCQTDSWITNYKSNRIRGVSKVGGNAMSLLYGANFTGEETVFPNDVGDWLAPLCDIFYNNTNLKNADELFLPATTLIYLCYCGMFAYCTNLESAQIELPALRAKQNCYNYMFAHCNSLVTGPSELPATMVEFNCYTQMFYDCTSLVTAPEMPYAQRLTSTDFNYANMFNGCSSINYIKALFNPGTTTGSSAPTTGWLNGVSSTGTFYKAAGTTWPTGTSGIPTGWTVVEV